MDLERFDIVRQLQHGLTHHGFLEFHKGSLTITAPVPLLDFLQQLSQGSGNLGVALDETSVVVGQPKERSQLGHLGWRLPIINGPYLVPIHLDHAFPDDMA